MEIINPLSSYEDAIKDHHLESLEKETKKNCHSPRNLEDHWTDYTANARSSPLKNTK